MLENAMHSSTKVQTPPLSVLFFLFGWWDLSQTGSMLSFVLIILVQIVTWQS